MYIASPPATLAKALCLTERAWNAAATPWNPAALAALYTNDAVFFGGRPDHSVGPAIIDYFTSYVGVLSSASLALNAQHILPLGPDAFVAQGFANFAFTLASGERTASTLRTTWVLVDREGWKLKVHHFSPPPQTPPIGT